MKVYQSFIQMELFNEGFVKVLVRIFTTAKECGAAEGKENECVLRVRDAINLH